MSLAASSGSPVLLITGFGPFPGMPRNPSAALARRLERSSRLRSALGRALRVRVLDTTYDAIGTQLVPTLAQAPAAVLMLGVASRAKRIRVEARACNRASRFYPDASGRPSAHLTLDPDGPPARRAFVAPQALAIMRRHGLAAGRSRDAGRYLCNASYFRALAEPCPVLFVHIPPAAAVRRPRDAAHPRHGRPDPAAQARALTEVALFLCVRGRAAASKR
ncbi:peptidase C15 [Methylobacterium sp. E-025]|uniref:pyroglutamyl-peptidase I family protein n=1 Tax=Methylobacterium sp. E-025 TaxID=2836561 RepID=UPI001FBA2945|nr:peptidase C15 [Methylobacterium sp. E-025]MCJ2114885.1 peptidase C15 [Methylobacterium sp. E-025]